jgi:hypothetical protein
VLGKLDGFEDGFLLGVSVGCPEKEGRTLGKNEGKLLGRILVVGFKEGI